MNVAIVGLGLIGGSVLQALAVAGHPVTGYDADPATRDLARAGGWPVADSVPAAVAGADLVVLAVPLPALPTVLDDLAGYDGLVTDVTSVKGPVHDLAAKHGLRRFVGGHPMAGKETSGFAAAEAGLFAGCAWVLCLEPDETDLADWLRLARLCTALGARVVPVTAAEHDRAVAQISHVPHLLAAALASTLTENPLAATLAAGSFRDGTRVAATRAELIAAMCGGNAAAVRSVLSAVLGDLEAMRVKLGLDDPTGALIPVLRPAVDARRQWPPRPGPSDETPAEVGELLALGRDGGWITAVAENGATVSSLRPESGRNGS
ncbi:prephenate dehydrogenase [Paractinoplanes rishiriensis]|uniref:Prephenate dehydrogenase n=1 Tax=Paractinoplanes rishiriensis TaxID=1050105 RepID=A0A919K076_9ACTN|nr:prephenate dehydrogenase/arogenate dehydrogenase family protein [Actinoplanes rishiriensis]GIE96670.1 prephenate dehydrogenase [Actinoplanes rishiriensis]